VNVAHPLPGRLIGWLDGRPAGRALAYLLLAVLMSWPLALHLHESSLGYPNVDAMDTQMLRGLVAGMLGDPLAAVRQGTDAIYFPVGYPVLELTPNLLDHLSAAPLVWLLPFPLADNLWWLLVLAANGLAADALGRRIGGAGAGWLCGVGFQLCEPLAREANLHHAPQAMAFAAPLALLALLDLREASGRAALRAGARAGAWLALLGLCYWYHALFLLLGALGLLWGAPRRGLLAMGATLGLLAAPGLLPFLLSWGDIPLTSGEQAPAPAQLPASYAALPGALQFIAQHGNDLLFWLRRAPMDTSNRLSLALLVGAVLGARRWEPAPRRAFAFMALLGSLMLLGPYLRVGEGVASIGGHVVSLPFQWMRSLHPLFGRLTWPERWGVVVPLALLALAARAPRPALLALLVGLESLIVSANLPLQSTPLRHQRCWAELAAGEGAVLVLPLDRTGLQAPRVGVQQRFFRRDVVNPVLLPPGAQAPPAWKQWIEGQALLRYLRVFEEGKWPPDPGADAVRALRAAGVGAIAVDAEPGAILTPGGINRIRAGLGRHLGAPVDLGCALVWWMDGATPRPVGLEDGDAWREEARRWKAAHPEPDLDTLIEPTWGAVKQGRLIE
jgi:hypothetical protein